MSAIIQIHPILDLTQVSRLEFRLGVRLPTGVDVYAVVAIENVELVVEAIKSSRGYVTVTLKGEVEKIDVAAQPARTIEAVPAQTILFPPREKRSDGE